MRVATKLLLNCLVESRKLVGRYILAEVVYKYSLYILVKSLVPLVAVILESKGALALLCSFAVLCRNHWCKTYCTWVKLWCAVERFAQSGKVLCNVKLFCIKLSHLVEVEFAFEVSCPLLVCHDAVLKVGLLTDYANRVDTLVHTKRVLPIVGTLGILRIVLDAYALIGTHMLNHNILLNATHLSSRSVLSVAHLTYSIAWKVAFGRTRITYSHGKVAFLVSV